MNNNNNSYTDTTTRRYQNSNYEKTKDGWVKKVEETEAPATAVASPADTRKEYTDEELAEYAKKASDGALKKAGAGRDERMRVAAKREIMRRRNEGMPEPEKSDNPFDEGLEKGWFDEFPTKTVLGKEYINKGQGWEPLEKGRRAEVGEIRTWSGEKYQRVEGGWKYLGKATGGAAKEPEKPSKPAYDKPWPESLDRLTNRSDYETILGEATSAAENKFNKEYPDPEVYYQKQADYHEKYPWDTDKFPKDGTDQVKAQWKETQKRFWITTEAKEIMGTFRNPSLSKTAMLANIKDYWKDVQQKKDQAKADADYKALIESPAGAAKRKEFGEALKSNAEAFIAKKNELKAKVLDTIKAYWATGVLTDEKMSNLKVKVSPKGLTISGLSSRWNDVEIQYDKGWDSEDREYKVQTSAYGSIEPGSEEARIIALQSQCLTNPAIIDVIKEAVIGVSEANKEMKAKNKEVVAAYPDFREDEVWEEVRKDIKDQD